MIKEIKIDKFPVVIFTDNHTNLSNVKLLKETYPDSPIISLGDITFLYNKKDEFNKLSIQYFIDNKIPCLKGNHEDYIARAFLWDWDIELHQIKYLVNLPIGFKLVLPDGNNYYCFHNEPYNLWNFPDQITQEYLNKYYIFDDKTVGIIQGHLHFNSILNLTPKRIVIGQLCNSNHHTGENNGRNYALLTEKGIEFKKL